MKKTRFDTGLIAVHCYPWNDRRPMPQARLGPIFLARGRIDKYNMCVDAARKSCQHQLQFTQGCASAGTMRMREHKNRWKTARPGNLALHRPGKRGNRRAAWRIRLSVQHRHANDHHCQPNRDYYSSKDEIASLITYEGHPHSRIFRPNVLGATRTVRVALAISRIRQNASPSINTDGISLASSIGQNRHFLNFSF